MANEQMVERGLVAKKQDLREQFVNAEQARTPFTSSVRKGPRLTNTYLEYPVDQYDKPRIKAVVDEAEPGESQNAAKHNAVLLARPQIFERVGFVSHVTNTTTDQAGRPSKKQLSYAIAKMLVEMKFDMELTFLGDTESREDNGTVGNQTRGLGKWIQNEAQSHYAVPEEFRTPASSIDKTTPIGSYSDDTIANVFRSSFDQHGNESSEMVLWCGSLFKKALGNLSFYGRQEANMVVTRSFNVDVGPKHSIGKVDIIDTAYGRSVVQMSRHINTGGDHTTDASKRLGYLCPMDMVELRFSDDPHAERLAKTSRSEKFLVTSIAALCVKNPLTFGKWAAPEPAPAP